MTIVSLPITLATTGGAGLINLWLAIRTGMVRRPSGIMIGDGGNERLRARMRAHANFLETGPLVLLLIAVIEIATGASTWLAIVGGAFLLARLIHPFGLEAADGNGIARPIGFAATALILLGLSLYAVTLVIVGPAASAPPIEVSPATAAG